MAAPTPTPQGLQLEVRPAHLADLAALEAFIERCSEETTYRRFHGATGSAVRRELQRIVHPEPAHRSWVVTDGSEIHGTATLATGSDGAVEAAFLVEDECGEVRVEPRGWSRLFVKTLRITDPGQHQAGLQVERFFDRYGQERRTFFHGFDPFGRIVYHERAIPIGAVVAVLGVVEEPGDGALGEPRLRGYREARRPLTLAPAGDGRLLVSDRPAHQR